MRPLRELIGREMRWKRTRLLPAAYELRMDDETLAALEWREIFSRAALATCAEGTWRFRRSSLISLVVLLIDAGTGTEAGRYSPGPRGGTLRLADGSTYRVGRDGFFGPLTVWRQDGGRLLHFSRLLMGRDMQLDASASAEPRLGLLATFAFYLLVLRRRRAANSGGG